MKIEDERNEMPGVIWKRSWWESMTRTLSIAECYDIVHAVMEYAFHDIEPTTSSKVVRLMFETIRPYIDSDRQQYQARCERNRKNARGRQRVAASGSEWQRVATNTNNNTNTNTNTNTNNKVSLSIEKERFLIIGLFFARGAVDCAGELNRFWDYYSALGWKNNKGATIVSKVAAARMWGLQNTSERDIELRRIYAKVLCSSELTNIQLFVDVIRFEKDDDILAIHAKNVREFAALADKSAGALLPRMVSAAGCTRLEYRS